jgi:hypothetical protein
MTFKHHRELVRPAEAQAWFGLMPAGKNRIRRLAGQHENPKGKISDGQALSRACDNLVSCAGDTRRQKISAS